MNTPKDNSPGSGSPSTRRTPSASPSSEETGLQIHDDPVARARELYITELTVNLADALKSQGLPAQVAALAEDEDWKGQKERYFQDRYHAKNALYREVASEKRLPMVNTQLQIIEALQTQILGFLRENDGMGSQELRRMSETLASVTGSINALLGIKEALQDGQKNATIHGSGDQYFFFPGAQPVTGASRHANPSRLGS